MELIFTKVKGISHCQDAANACSLGEELDLVPEPSNPHDSNAIRIERQARATGSWYVRDDPEACQVPTLVGYLDRDLAAELAAPARSYKITAHVFEILGGQTDQLAGIRIRLEVDRPPSKDAAINHSEAHGISMPLAADLLGDHKMEIAVQITTCMEAVQRALSAYDKHEISNRTLGEVAVGAFETMLSGDWRQPYQSWVSCTDSKRIAGAVSLILGDRSLGVYIYFELMQQFETSSAPQCIIRLLATLQLRFTPEEKDRPAERGGPAGADMRLAWQFYRGVGKPKDLRFAERELADEADDIGIWNESLGYCTEDTSIRMRLFNEAVGIDKESDDAGMAALIYRVLANRGCSASAHNLACLYSAGQGVDQCDDEAVYWFRRAKECYR